MAKVRESPSFGNAECFVCMYKTCSLVTKQAPPAGAVRGLLRLRLLRGIRLCRWPNGMAVGQAYTTAGAGVYLTGRRRQRGQCDTDGLRR